MIWLSQKIIVYLQRVFGNKCYAYETDFHSLWVYRPIMSLRFK